LESKGIDVILGMD
jgi:hypothetical protein